MSAWPGDVYLKSYRPSCTFFGYIPGFGPPGALKKRHLEALFDRFLPDPSADARTPQNGVLFAHFAPRSLQTGRRDRETKHAIH